MKYAAILLMLLAGCSKAAPVNPVIPWPSDDPAPTHAQAVERDRQAKGIMDLVTEVRTLISRTTAYMEWGAQFSKFVVEHPLPSAPLKSTAVVEVPVTAGIIQPPAAATTEALPFTAGVVSQPASPGAVQSSPPCQGGACCPAKKPLIFPPVIPPVVQQFPAEQQQQPVVQQPVSNGCDGGSCGYYRVRRWRQ